MHQVIAHATRWFRRWLGPKDVQGAPMKPTNDPCA
jgi:hypothetical protein